MNRIVHCEKDGLDQFKKLQLPHSAKKLGFWLFGICFVGLFLNKFTMDQEILRMTARYGLLFSLLMISVSREEVEDELVTSLRMQSYTFAFVFGVIFSLAMPFVDYLLDYIMVNRTPVFEDVGDWEILWMLLSIQVFYFEVMRRRFS